MRVLNEIIGELYEYKLDAASSTPPAYVVMTSAQFDSLAAEARAQGLLRTPLEAGPAFMGMEVVIAGSDLHKALLQQHRPMLDISPEA